MSLILHVNHTARLGGAEMSLLTLMGNLDPAQFQPVLACPGGGLLPVRATALGIPVHTVNLCRFRRRLSRQHLALAARFSQSLFQLTALIRRLKPSVVHANSTSAAIIALPVARLYQARTIWHIRDMVPLGFVTPWLTRLADAIVVSARHMLDSAVLDGIPRDRLWVIPNGVDVNRFERVTRDPMSERGPCVGMIGQLVPWKRHTDFLQAASLIKAAMPEVRFVNVAPDYWGDQGEYRQQLTALATALNLESSLSWMDYQEDIATLLASWDVIVLPSYPEPFGRVVIEGWAAGALPIATDACGPRELIEHGKTGMLVPCGDYSALAQATIAVLQNPRWRESMVQAGKAVVRERYAARGVAKQFEACLYQLLA